VVKLADAPSCLGGGEIGKNLLTNHSVKVRILPLQQNNLSYRKGGFFIGDIKTSLTFAQAPMKAPYLISPIKNPRLVERFNVLFIFPLLGGKRKMNSI
jgi:hypothetical protein